MGGETLIVDKCEERDEDREERSWGQRSLELTLRIYFIELEVGGVLLGTLGCLFDFYVHDHRFYVHGSSIYVHGPRFYVNGPRFMLVTLGLNYVPKFKLYTLGLS